MKKIVTHINPDLDAVTSAWLIKRFLPGWEEAEIKFSTADDSKNKDRAVDKNPEILWVDVGWGKLDHHQTGGYLSASGLCLSFIKKERKGQEIGDLQSKCLEELVEVVTQIDNAADLNWGEVSLSRYYFQLHTLLDGLRGLSETDQQVIEFGFRALDSVFWNLKNKFRAQQALNKTGIEFQSQWGKAIAVESGDKHVLWVGEIQGYVLVVKKDPELGGVRIYARPDSKVDLSQAYHFLQKKDPESDWFLHASKKLLLNHSTVNPGMRPTKLSLEEIIAILKN